MTYIFIQSHSGCPIPSFSARGVQVGSGEIYKHPTDLLRQKDRWSSTFVDVILDNTRIESRAVEESALNVYVLGGDSGGRGDDYLKFRLRRMYEVWRRCGGIVVSERGGWEELEGVLGRLGRVDLSSRSFLINKYLDKITC